MKIALIVIGVLIAGMLFRMFSGEKERIKTLFRIYCRAKERFPAKSERQLLEIVVEEHILPGRSVRLRSTGITGKMYIDEVFGSDPPDINRLISHIVRLEFPKKYRPHHIDLEEIGKQVTTGKLSVGDELNVLIEKYSARYLG